MLTEQMLHKINNACLDEDMAKAIMEDDQDDTFHTVSRAQIEEAIAYLRRLLRGAIVNASR